MCCARLWSKCWNARRIPPRHRQEAYPIAARAAKAALRQHENLDLRPSERLKTKAPGSLRSGLMQKLFMQVLPPLHRDAAEPDSQRPTPSCQDEPGRSEPRASWPTVAALALIRFYQLALSPLIPPSCRYYPTCSHYTYGAITRFGLARGGWLGLKRLCRCHPFAAGGCDPVPPREEVVASQHRELPLS